MEPRIRWPDAAPGIATAMAALDRYVRSAGLEQSLLELVKIRASQLNACAYCIDLHTKDARALGETEQRLYALGAWRDTPFYTPRERAALDWTETLTLVAQAHAPDDVYDRVRPHFTEKELVDLTLAIASINAWNRISVGMRDVPGAYVSKYARRAPVNEVPATPSA